jgi:hypothetical protein
MAFGMEAAMLEHGPAAAGRQSVESAEETSEWIVDRAQVPTASCQAYSCCYAATTSRESRPIALCYKGGPRSTA